MKVVENLIEFSHIYMDEKYGISHIMSKEILLNLTSNLDKNSYGTVILIDDINIENSIWCKKDLVNTLTEGIDINFIALESKFDIIAEEILNNIPKNYLKEETFRKEKKTVLFYKDSNKIIPIKTIYDNNSKFSCIFLSLSWTLCKLGIYKFPNDSLLKINNIVIGTNLINILPEKYRNTENNMFYLLNKLFNRNSNKIKHIYF